MKNVKRVISESRKKGQYLFILFFLIGVTGCNETGRQSVREPVTTESPVISTATPDVENLSFNELFTSIKETDIPESVFKLVGSDYTVITAGKNKEYNSMVASYGGWGILFEKPVTWCFLRANRYTLEFIRREQTYTMTYFEEIHKEQFMVFGTKSGRNTDKMTESKLTPVETPSGDMTYKEAKLIIECKLTELTTVSPDDFLTSQGRDFVLKAYEEANDYHKLVFGEITNVWIRK